jgi:uncharacterized protein (DUF1778 family)
LPTTKPRISITLDASDLAVIDRFASAAGKPRASFIAEILSSAVPQFARAAEIMELAREAPAGVVRGVVDDLDRATTDLLGVLAESVDGAEEVIQKAAGRGPRMRGTGTAAKRRKRPQDPHLLTGGSK